MAVYICERCGEYKDGDWDVCVEHPTDPTALLCEGCAGELEDEIEEERKQYAIDEAQTALAVANEPVEDLG